LTDHKLASWNTYQAAWADISNDARQSLLEQSISPDVVYTDPTSVSTGYGELTTKMQATQQNYPGATFRNDKFDTHHNHAISHWTMLDTYGEPIFAGVSYAEFASDDRLKSMIGFFEPVN
jgi:hypothetical protein